MPYARKRTPRRRTAAIALAVCLGALAGTGAAAAQEVYWSAPEGLAAGQPAAIDLVFLDTAPAGAIDLPPIDALQVLGAPSQSTHLTFLNGRRSASVTLSFPVRAAQAGTLRLPEFRLATDAGAATVAAIEVEVGRAALRDADGATTALDDAVQARLTPATMAPYAGEVFDLDFSLALRGDRRGEVLGSPSWTAATLATEPWGSGEAVRTASRSAVRFRTRALAPSEPGRMALAPVTQALQLESGHGRDPFGGSSLLDAFFARPQLTPLAVESNAVQLDVRPLPAPPPADFSGAVGQFALRSTLTPATARTGEPVTWTLTLTGTGNWPSLALPARAVPADLRTLQPKQERQFAAGERFHGALSEALVLLPDQPGDVTLAPVRFVYFDPASGRYETVEARPPLLRVHGAPPAQGPAAAAAPAPAAGETSAAWTAAPLPGHAYGRVPLAVRTLAGLAALPFVAFLAAWLTRLLWRAWQADPRRAARRRRRALRAAIESVRGAVGSDARIAALLAWQRQAARWLGLDRAAPTAALLRQLDDARWAAVWADSERALYGRAHALPPGWCDGALALCAADPAPSRRPSASPSATRTRAILDHLRRAVVKTAPAALLLVWCAMPPSAGAAASADLDGAATAPLEADRRAGEDAGALDWIARYNLGIGEAAAGRPGHALGETLAAFAQAPRQAPVHAALGALTSALPHPDAALVALAGGARPAAWLAVWQWQAVLLGAALLLAVALACGATRQVRLAIGSAALGALLALGAGLALRQYGALADPRAALVAQDVVLRALPTDAAPADSAAALSVGTLVSTEREFLGWTAIRLADGGGGWVRRGELVTLYSAPSI